MTRILVQRGTTGSSSNSNRSSLPGSSSAPPQQQVHSPLVHSTAKDEELVEEVQEQPIADTHSEFRGGHDDATSDECLNESFHVDKTDSAGCANIDNQKAGNDKLSNPGELTKGFSGLKITDRPVVEHERSRGHPSQIIAGNSHPPPPPVPPPKPSLVNSNARRSTPGSSNAIRNVSSRRTVVWPVVSTRTSPTASRPSSPRTHGDNEGYNSADEQNPCFGSSYGDAERERQFELDIGRAKGLQVKRMLEDGNCLFRAVADQVYGDSEAYDLARQMCIDYMEQERDHFSQFITEGFTSYCKRKRRDKVYGNNIEIQALSEIYNRPIHIYSYSTEPINIFHRSYSTDTPPIRLSYHHGNHYNSLVDPRRLTTGAGLGFSSLRGRDIDKDQVKAAIKAQQDQQIDNALLAEGRFYSDLEVTEKEIERMVLEASRAEYVVGVEHKQKIGPKESSTSGAEPSSSGARPSGSRRETGLLPDSMQMLMSMGFSYLQVTEAYSIFGDDVDSMVCYLVETASSSSSRRKGKATE